MEDFLQRARLLYGDEAVDKLKNSAVAIFGIGGVGGHAAEAIARSGVGTIVCIDKDIVDKTNINRQIVALSGTVGEPKAKVMAKRIMEINPEAKAYAVCERYESSFPEVFKCVKIEAVADCIDDVCAKLNLICECKKNGIPIVSSMGMAQRTRPDMLKISDVYKSENDPLAKVMRKGLRERGIEGLTCVYSSETPRKMNGNTLGSNSFVPASAGLCIASVVIDFLMGRRQTI